MSGRSAKAARRAVISRREILGRPTGVDLDALHAEAVAADWRPAPGIVNPRDVWARLGVRDWTPPVRHGEADDTGWRYQRHDNTLLILVSAACWPELPDVPIVHASISRHTPVQTPTYADLQLLHRAVFPDGHAIQCFVPPDDHVNIRWNVLHLWGRADNQPLWPINFGRFGTI